MVVNKNHSWRREKKDGGAGRGSGNTSSIEPDHKERKNGKTRCASLTAN